MNGWWTFIFCFLTLSTAQSALQYKSAFTEQTLRTGEVSNSSFSSRSTISDILRWSLNVFKLCSLVFFFHIKQKQNYQLKFQSRLEQKLGNIIFSFWRLWGWWNGSCYITPAFISFRKQSTNNICCRSYDEFCRSTAKKKKIITQNLVCTDMFWQDCEKKLWVTT